jgi:thiol:disulfide interchange protein DsbD
VAVKLGYKNVYRDPLGYPEWQAKGFPVQSTPAGLSSAPLQPKEPGPLAGWAMIWTLLGIFAGGIALNLTPCVYPLIPITVSYFGGRSGRSKGQLITHGACYIGGLAVTNSVLGVAAALTGGLMGTLLQNPVILALISAVLVIFAASLFGFWELRLPSGLTQTASKTYSGYFGSLFMGLTLGVIAAPCIGPFVLGLLTWIASAGSPSLGFLVFFTLSLGLGLPLFFLGIFSGHLEKLPRSGEWMLWVRRLMGWVLIGMAAYFIRPILPKAGGIWLLGGVALAAGLHLGWLDRTQASFRFFGRLKTMAGVLGLVLATWTIGSFLIRGPGVDWQAYSERVLAEAQKSGKPAILDFSAEWCTPCREMDEVTFRDPQIVNQAKNGFVMVKVDLTQKGDSSREALVNKFGVKGVPTVVFLDAKGRERADLRLVDFLPANQFLIRMAELKQTF